MALAVVLMLTMSASAQFRVNIITTSSIPTGTNGQILAMGPGGLPVFSSALLVQSNYFQGQVTIIGGNITTTSNGLLAQMGQRVAMNGGAVTNLLTSGTNFFSSGGDIYGYLFVDGNALGVWYSPLNSPAWGVSANGLFLYQTTTIDGLDNPNKVWITDGNGAFAQSTVTGAELLYSTGLRSNIQSQIDYAIANGGGGGGGVSQGTLDATNTALLTKMFSLALANTNFTAQKMDKTNGNAWGRMRLIDLGGANSNDIMQAGTLLVISNSSGGIVWSYDSAADASTNGKTTYYPLVTALRVAQFGAGGVLQSSGVSNAELAYVGGVTGALQTQINANKAGAQAVSNDVTELKLLQQSVTFGTGTLATTNNVTNVVVKGGYLVGANMTFTTNADGTITIAATGAGVSQANLDATNTALLFRIGMFGTNDTNFGFALALANTNFTAQKMDKTNGNAWGRMRLIDLGGANSNDIMQAGTLLVISNSSGGILWSYDSVADAATNSKTTYYPLVTALRVAQFGAGGVLQSSGVSNAELAYVGGVTGALQTQINGNKAGLQGVSNDVTELKLLNTNWSASVGGGLISSTVNGSNGAFALALTNNYQSFFIGAGAFWPAATNQATNGTFTQNGTNQYKADTWDFDATTNEWVQTSFTLDDAWDLGTLKFKLIWGSTNTTTSGNTNVVWEIQAGAIRPGVTVSNLYSTQFYTTNGLRTNYMLNFATTGPVTVDNTPAIGDLINLQIGRIGTNTSDTLGGDAKLLGVNVQWRRSLTYSNAVW